ncbi:hypothetical protein L596_023161 [Steinernema carpocapsae]|uniref:Uncharacterized protein n=1 Tax=Steinernema carpocapsae TaxID=34508 RepID=A0A4U5MCU1_STECR|nr:hypothetical protein L596_023161 [Steinernema carpocapsae]
MKTTVLIAVLALLACGVVAENELPLSRPCRFMCLIACVCFNGTVTDLNAVRPPNACCWCPPCIPVSSTAAPTSIS